MATKVTKNQELVNVEVCFAYLISIFIINVSPRIVQQFNNRFMELSKGIMIELKSSESRNSDFISGSMANERGYCCWPCELRSSLIHINSS